jgi:transcriptional regulator with XRE-family HTH domain
VHHRPTTRLIPNSGFTIADEMPRKKKEDSSFGPRLATLRKARGLTQVQLAEAAQTTQRSISYYENDDGVPPSSVVMGLAQALQVSADELLGLKPSPKAAPLLTEQDPETRRLWKRFQVVAQLPEKDQRAVIRLIHSLAAVATPRRNGTHGGERNGRH